MVMVHHMHMSAIHVFNCFSSQFWGGVADEGAVDAGYPVNVLRNKTDVVGHHDDGNVLIQPLEQVEDIFFNFHK